MNKHLPLEEEIDAAMQSLEGMQPAVANEFLYTRIQQRIRNKQEAKGFGNIMFRLAVVLLVFIAANVFTYEKIGSDATPSNGKSSIETFASDYGLSNSGDNI